MNRWRFGFVLVAAAAVGLAFYLEWFRLASDSADGKFNITLTVDTGKIQQGWTRVPEKDPGFPAQGRAASPAERD